MIHLRKRRHNITLPEKKGHLAAKNFIIRLLYKDTYSLHYRHSHNFFFSFLMFVMFLMWFSLCLSVTPLRSVSCVFTIKIGLDWIGIQ